VRTIKLLISPLHDDDDDDDDNNNNNNNNNLSGIMPSKSLPI
jgi:hypothetical protein